MQSLEQVKARIKELFCLVASLNHKDFTIDFVLDYPKNNDFGDLYTNIAMVGARQAKMPPVQIATKLAELIAKEPFALDASVAGGGFINIKIKQEFWQAALGNALHGTLANYGFANYGGGEAVNIEYVSANPTGPIHLGHTRGSVYGDVIARLLAKCGYAVTKEYYINDAGVQVGKLVKSVFIRYQQAQGMDIALAEDCYPGDYLVKPAQDLLATFGNSLNAERDFELIRAFAIEAMMEQIKQSLTKLGIKHDVYTSEFETIKAGYVDKMLDLLKSKDLTYIGTTEQPKGKAAQGWVAQEQLLFKSKQFGDDEDRVLITASGAKTYFVSDVAYQLHKIERGFKNMILVIGADHLGYVKRIKAATHALHNEAKLDVKLCQLVKFVKNGEPVKMSKRKGTFETLDDVLEEVDQSIIRFIMISKKNDTHMDFDLEKVKEQSKENEIFYIQYAYSRASSVLKTATDLDLKNINLSILTKEADLQYIKKVLEYPKIIKIACHNAEPHHIAFYLYELAGCFHKIWHEGNLDKSLRFIQENDIIKTNTRLSLAFIYKYIVDSSFDVFGIKPLDQM